MELTGRRSLAFDRPTVWAGLNDPATLQRAIPGCESVERLEDGRYAVALTASLGPVRAKFRGKLSLEDVAAPERYVLRFQGEGGGAGFASGEARVTLAEAPGGTDLAYLVKAQVGGRIAQVGSRLIDSAALKLADDFFANLERELAGAAPAAASAPVTRAPAAQPDPWRMRIMIASLVAALVASVFLLLR